jgi:transglutaminase-like putative cysteine protease
MDFSAWFEVYLQGQWYTFDARHNRPRIGRVLMGLGRDAADVPITMSFGQQSLEVFRVITEEIDLAVVPSLPRFSEEASGFDDLMKRCR